MSPRIRRLSQDHETLKRRFANWPLIQMTGTAGLPPEHYRFTYAIKGLYVDPTGQILDRNEAELWRERYPLAPVSELAPVEEGEVYAPELFGMSVGRAGLLEPVGEVTDVYELPQGVMLDVRRSQGSVLIPFRGEVVTRVDLAERRLEIDPPEGLLE